MNCLCGEKVVAANRCKTCIEIAFEISPQVREKKTPVAECEMIKRAVVEILRKLTKENYELAR